MWKIAWKNIKKMKAIYGMIAVLMILVFLICVFISSAITIKTEEYSSLRTFLKQDGICMNVNYIQLEQEGVPLLVRDEKELKERFPELKDVVAMETTWEVSVMEVNANIELLCYNENVVNGLHPKMASGRWFEDSDKQDSILKVVVTYNDGKISVGDVITLTESGELAASGKSAVLKAEVIGVIDNDENIYYSDGVSTPQGDYRDFYYTYDYEAEQGKIFVIASDAQVLAGEKDGKFRELNFRLSPDYGIQKQMTGQIILTFKKGTTKERIREIGDTLRPISGINSLYTTKEVDAKSRAYIYEELRRFLPIGICIFLFVIVAVISAHVISAKENIRDYAIYYICGLTWKKCVGISFSCSFILILTAWLTILISLAGLGCLHVVDMAVFHFSYLHIISVLGMTVIFMLLSGFIPYRMMKKDSPVRVLKENFG